MVQETEETDDANKKIISNMITSYETNLKHTFRLRVVQLVNHQILNDSTKIESVLIAQANRVLQGSNNIIDNAVSLYKDKFIMNYSNKINNDETTTLDEFWADHPGWGKKPNLVFVDVNIEIRYSSSFII